MDGGEVQPVLRPVETETSSKKWIWISIISVVILVVIVLVLIIVFSRSSTISEEELLVGKTIELENGEKIDFVVSEEVGEHTLTVDSVSFDSATITFQSEKVTLTLNIEEEKSVDLNGDGTNDIKIKLEKIEDGKPFFRIEKISQAQNTLSVIGSECEAQEGTVCSVNQQCTTGFRYVGSDDVLCCFGECFRPGDDNQNTNASETCAELGGQFCYQNLCDGNKVSSSDGPSLGKECCIGSCPSEERTPCSSSTDCNDSNPCTNDLCGLAGIPGCGYTEISGCQSGCSDGTAKDSCSTNKPKYCNQYKTLIDKCSECGCPSEKECIQDKCLTRLTDGSYIYTQNDFEALEVDLVQYPFSQTTLEQYALPEGYIFDAYYTYVGEPLINLKFVMYVAKGPFNDGTTADDYKVQGTIISEDEYGDNSVRIEVSPGARIIGIEKGEWFISISYQVSDESIVNSLITTGLGRI